MFWMAMGIWLIVAGYFLVLALEYSYVPHMHGVSMAKPALRRRMADPLMLLAATGYGIYRTLNDADSLPLLLPLLLLAAVLLVMMLRVPRWHLKAEGFIYWFRFVPYRMITKMALSQTGELLIVLSNGGKITLAFKNMAAVEEAAAFFANEQYLQQMFTVPLAEENE